MRTSFSVEGDGRETVGKEPVIRKSEVWQGNNNIHGGKLLGPFFNGPRRRRAATRGAAVGAALFADAPFV